MIKLCDVCITHNSSHLGRTVYLPLGRKFTDPNLVLALQKEGKKIIEIAARLKITDRRVYQILQTIRDHSNGLD